ncbi:hypothetical protein [Mesorhizobium sp. CN2-181]|uniref:hypothetical protein n=1 Tax=Mesorhizobium yinganensis TaxID=3157707 RepID=UPI0032B755AF
MCFNNSDADIPAPAPPPEVLKQAAPAKKKTAETPASALAIGTKKYRTASGIGTAGLGTNSAPTGIGVS